MINKEIINPFWKAKMQEATNTTPAQPFATREDVENALSACIQLTLSELKDPDIHKRQEWGTPSDIGRMFGTTRERAADWLRKPAAEGKIRMMRPNGEGAKGTYYNIADTLAVFAVKQSTK